MPKHDFLSPKAISNRIKSKGLQKLRWYCQMCQKQCRDENGFKCHISSESHQRQLLLVAENPGRYVHAFSEEFLHDFMKLLSRQYGTRRVHANEVYQEYIKDKSHYHMNATRWTTLTGFVMFLGKTGMCEVEPTPKGWFIKYVDRSPAVLAREQATAKKSKMDKDDAERSQKMIEDQITRALATKGDKEESEHVYTELQREDESEKVVLSLFKSSSGLATSSASTSDTETSTSDGDVVRDGEGGGGGEGGEEGRGEVGGEGEERGVEAKAEGRSASGVVEIKQSLNGRFARPKHPLSVSHVMPNVLKNAAGSSGGGGGGEKGNVRKKREGERDDSRKRKRSALEEIREMEEQRKEKMNRRDYWIMEGVVVKVIHKKLYYRQKGVVEGLHDQYTAVVRMLESGDNVKFDQAHLETVIPAIGKPVMVVNGAYRGVRAILEALDTAKFCVSVRVDQGPARGRLVERVPYEDICKLYMHD